MKLLRNVACVEATLSNEKCADLCLQLTEDQAHLTVYDEDFSVPISITAEDMNAGLHIIVEFNAKMEAVVSLLWLGEFDDDDVEDDPSYGKVDTTKFPHTVVEVVGSARVGLLCWGHMTIGQLNSNMDQVVAQNVNATASITAALKILSKTSRRVQNLSREGQRQLEAAIRQRESLQDTTVASPMPDDRIFASKVKNDCTACRTGKKRKAGTKLGLAEGGSSCKATKVARQSFGYLDGKALDIYDYGPAASIEAKTSIQNPSHPLRHSY